LSHRLPGPLSDSCALIRNTAAAGLHWAGACTHTVFWEQGTREETCECRAGVGAISMAAKAVSLQCASVCTRVSMSPRCSCAWAGLHEKSRWWWWERSQDSLTGSCLSSEDAGNSASGLWRVG